ncbi:hypothetical protein [Streptomyces sp. NPDC001657]|uniref:hypothetical protein n=1 Tax=Streptomyces sp. NPDC001657 TaxID=3154522 RepID=UPI003332674C
MVSSWRQRSAPPWPPPSSAFALLVGSTLMPAVVELGRALRPCSRHLALTPVHLGGQTTLWMTWPYGEGDCCADWRPRSCSAWPGA